MNVVSVNVPISFDTVAELLLFFSELELVPELFPPELDGIITGPPVLVNDSGHVLVRSPPSGQFAVGPGRHILSSTNTQYAYSSALPVCDGGGKSSLPSSDEQDVIV
jgi:hypothetical protein